MFRLWAKEIKNNRCLKDITISNDNPDLNRTRKIYLSIDEICSKFDLSKPIWLDKNISEFKLRDKTRFYQDNFIDSINFDYLEIHVITEDDSI